MPAALLEPFSDPIGQRALAEVVIIGAACGPLGVWVVLYRQSYAAESIAHGMLPGLVIASLAGIPLGLGAAAGLAVAALAISLARRIEGIAPDTAVAVAVTGLFGAGALLALSPEAPARLGELLFGDPLSVGWGEISASAAVAVAILTALALLYRPLALSAFDRQTAPSLGASPARTELALLIVLATAVFVAVQALGNLLVVALIVAPPAAAARLAERLPTMLALAAGLAISGGVAGLYASYYLDTAAGASIALATIAIYVLSLVGGALAGTAEADAGAQHR
jgi:ABC-type Mn2+/Zn2+ transport system permease subunit